MIDTTILPSGRTMYEFRCNKCRAPIGATLLDETADANPGPHYCEKHQPMGRIPISTRGRIHRELPLDDDAILFRGMLLPVGDGGHDLEAIGVLCDENGIELLSIPYGVSFRFRDGRILDWWPNTGSQIWRKPQQAFRARGGDALTTIRYSLVKAKFDQLLAEQPKFPDDPGGYYSRKAYEARVARLRLEMRIIRYGEHSEEADRARRKLEMALYTGD